MFPLKLLPAFNVIKPTRNIFVFMSKNHPIKALFKKDAFNVQQQSITLKTNRRTLG
jgi:hypothetical protein